MLGNSASAIERNLVYIGMFSKVRTKFMYNKKLRNYTEIRSLNRKKIKRSRRYKLYYIRTVVMWKDKPVVLYFTRKGKRGNWKVLISTDLSSNFNQTVSIYQIRWSIEVFFKECKQSLQLGKCQSTNLDAQIADTTITFIQYQFLAIRNQLDRYESLGALLRNTKAVKLELKLHQRLVALLMNKIECLGTLFEDVDDASLISKLIHNEKFFDQIKTLLELESRQHKQAA